MQMESESPKNEKKKNGIRPRGCAGRMRRCFDSAIACVNCLAWCRGEGKTGENPGGEEEMIDDEGDSAIVAPRDIVVFDPVVREKKRTESLIPYPSDMSIEIHGGSVSGSSRQQLPSAHSQHSSQSHIEEALLHHGESSDMELDSIGDEQDDEIDKGNNNANPPTISSICPDVVVPPGDLLQSIRDPTSRLALHHVDPPK